MHVYSLEYTKVTIYYENSSDKIQVNTVLLSW